MLTHTFAVTVWSVGAGKMANTNQCSFVGQGFTGKWLDSDGGLSPRSVGPTSVCTEVCGPEMLVTKARIQSRTAVVCGGLTDLKPVACIVLL